VEASTFSLGVEMFGERQNGHTVGGGTGSGSMVMIAQSRQRRRPMRVQRCSQP
jgi:hypothetical protein